MQKTFCHEGYGCLQWSIFISIFNACLQADVAPRMSEPLLVICAIFPAIKFWTWSEETAPFVWIVAWAPCFKTLSDIGLCLPTQLQIPQSRRFHPARYQRRIKIPNHALTPQASASCHSRWRLGARNNYPTRSHSARNSVKLPEVVHRQVWRLVFFCWNGLQYHTY